MNVNVDQSRADDLAGGINLIRAVRRLSRRIGADDGHLPVGEQQVGGFIKAVDGIDEAASLEQQRTHGAQAKEGGLTTQAGLVRCAWLRV